MNSIRKSSSERFFSQRAWLIYLRDIPERGFLSLDFLLGGEGESSPMVGYVVFFQEVRDYFLQAEAYFFR